MKPITKRTYDLLRQVPWNLLTVTQVLQCEDFERQGARKDATPLPARCRSAANHLRQSHKICAGRINETQ